MYGSNQYTESLYSQDNLDNEEIKVLIPDLMKYLPRYYKKSKVMNNLQQAIAKELGTSKYNEENTLNQMFVDTATSELYLWEKELGITTDLEKSYETRREIIKAKLRGSGTVTKTMLKNTALAYTNAEVDIIENYEDNSFIIKFVSVKGIPQNMEALKKTVEEIKPAHLNFGFEYTYNVWDFLKQNLTWREPTAKNKTWNDIRIY